MSEHRDPERLSPHPENERIYGTQCDDDFTESIRAKGVITPLLVTKADVIVSGHRRWLSAKQLGLAAIPVEVYDSEDDLDVLETLVHSNKGRTRTKEQLAREAAALRRVERERARRRQAEHGQTAPGRNKTLVELVPQVTEERGKSRDKVGEALGMCGKTAERAADVGEALQNLTAAGRTDEAERLRTSVNRGGFKRAHRQLPKSKPARAAAPPAAGAAPATGGMPQACARFREIGSLFRALEDEIHRICTEAGGEVLRKKANRRGGRFYVKLLKEARALVEGSRPYCAECPRCGTKGHELCALCEGRGWISYALWAQLSPEGTASLPLFPEPGGTQP